MFPLQLNTSRYLIFACGETADEGNAPHLRIETSLFFLTGKLEGKGRGHAVSPAGLALKPSANGSEEELLRPDVLTLPLLLPEDFRCLYTSQLCSSCVTQRQRDFAAQ